jgi:diamine N-acetyltransferase
MTAPACRIRRAGPADAGTLGWLGPLTFKEAFGGDFPAAVIEARMHAAYARDQLERDLGDPSQAWFLAHAGAEPVGFLALASGVPPACVLGPGPLELSRLYVREAWHGRGPAFALMGAGLEEAQARGAGTLWLQAWERNPKALAFYRAHGFRRSGEVVVAFAGRNLPHLVLVRAMKP